MKIVATKWLGLVLVAAESLAGQTSSFQAPKQVEAGTAFSVATRGTGEGTLYVVGPMQVLKRKVTLGEAIGFDGSDLHNAGHYTMFLAGSGSTEAADFEITSTHQPATISFLAKPSRIPVDLPGGLSGVVYLFDAFRNLIVEPIQVRFQLSEPGAPPEEKTVSAQEGVAWLKMNSAPKAGNAEFDAIAGGVTEKRIVEQVPGEPCNLKMTGHQSGDQIALETEPLRDCRGNPVPDGTIVTFSESYNGSESTVDAPVKRGVARTQLPAYNGAVISVATGVVMGNQIRWQEPGGRSER